MSGQKQRTIESTQFYNIDNYQVEMKKNSVNQFDHNNIASSSVISPNAMSPPKPQPPLPYRGS